MIPSDFPSFKSEFLNSLSLMAANQRYYLPKGFSISSPHEDEAGIRYYPRYFDRHGNLYDDTPVHSSLITYKIVDYRLDYKTVIKDTKIVGTYPVIDPVANLMDVSVTSAVIRRIYDYLFRRDSLYEFPPVMPSRPASPPARKLLAS